MGLVTRPSPDSSLSTWYALLNGVVPTAGSAELTVGRRAALDRIDESLDQVLRDRHARVDFVYGAYGEGKSHLLGLVRAAALKRGCAVVSLAADFTSVILHRPALLFHALASRLELPGHAAVGVVPLLRNLVEQSDFLDLADSLYTRWERSRPGAAVGEFAVWPSGFYAAAARPALVEPIARWLSGEPVLVSDIRKRIETVCDSPRRMAITVTSLPEIISGLAQSLSVLGYEGLVLLIDEAENALDESTPIQRRKSSELLGVLAKVRSPLYVVAAVTPEVEGKLREVLSLPVSPWSPPGLNAGVKYVLRRLGESERLQVPTLTRRDLATLAGKIADVHSRAFCWNARDHVGGDVLGKCVDFSFRNDRPTRAFVRAVVDTLELCEQYRDVPPEHFGGFAA